MHELEPLIGFDEVSAPGIPLGGQALAFDLGQSFLGFDLLPNNRRSFDEHPVVCLEVVDGRNWTVTGNQFRTRGNFGDQLADVPRQSFDTATAINIHKRKSAREEIIAEMDHVDVVKKITLSPSVWPFGK